MKFYLIMTRWRPRYSKSTCEGHAGDYNPGDIDDHPKYHRPSSAPPTMLYDDVSTFKLPRTGWR